MRLKKTGFSMVEVALALGLLAFCLVAIIGLIPVGLKSTHGSKEKYASSDVASALIANFQDIPPGLNAGTHWKVNDVTVPEPGDAPVLQTLYYSESLTAESHFSTTPQANCRYRVTIRVTAPASGQFYATCLHLMITWPSQINPGQAEGSAEFFSALDRNRP